MTPDLIETLACGRGHDGWWDEQHTTTVDARAERRVKPPPLALIAFMIGLLVGYVASDVRTTAEAASEPAVDGVPTLTVLIPHAGVRVGSLLTGHDRIDREWALVEQVYPEEAAFVTDIVIADSFGHGNFGAQAWVEECNPRKVSSVIYIDRRWARDASPEKLGETLAHELTHVTQCRDASPADYDARQREAEWREVDYRMRRADYVASLNLVEE
jgi:hypothetical protein